MKFTEGLKYTTTLLLVVVAFSQPAFAQDGLFTDDFSDLDNWEIRGLRWTGTIPYEGTLETFESTYELVNGTLYAGGNEYREYAQNVACTPNIASSYGNWSVEVKTPRVFKKFLISLVDGWFDQIGNTEDELNNSALVIEVFSTSATLNLFEPSDEAGVEKTIDLSSSSFDAKLRLGWHSYRIEKTETMLNFFMDESLLVSTPYSEGSLSEIQGFCLTGEVGSGVAFDNVFVSRLGVDHPQHIIPSTSDTSEASPPEIPNFLFYFMGAVMLGSMVYLGYRFKVRRAMSNPKSQMFDSAVIEKQFYEQFSWNPTDYLGLISLQQRDKYTIGGKSVYETLEQYKFLFHPTRLLIMQVVSENYKITSSYLREMLDISWGNISNNLKKLEEAGYLSTKNELHGSSFLQTIYLEEYGRNQYEAFTAIIDELINSSTFDSLYPNN